MNTKDKFNNILQSKFNTWQHPVDEVNWNEISKEIRSTHRAKMRTKWIAAGSAAILLSGIGLYALLNRTESKNEGKKTMPAPSGINSPAMVTSSQGNSSQKPLSIKENKAVNKNSSEVAVVNNSPKKVSGQISNPEKTNNTVSKAANSINLNSAAVSNDNKTPSEINPNAKSGKSATVAPFVVIINGPRSTCSGSAVTLCADISDGEGEESYTWQPGNLTGKCVTVSPTSTTIYTVSVSGDAGSNSATASVAVNPAPEVSFTSDIQKGCAPLTVQFKNLSTMTSGKITSWSWNFGDGDSYNSENPDYCYHNAGNYSVDLTVVADNGCSSTLNIPNMISAYSHPNARFTLSTQSNTLAGTLVQFKDGSTDAYGISNWSWNFYDGTVSTSNLQNPTHTYSDTGLYCTRLVVTNTYGCTDSTSNCLAIAPIFNLYIPSAFSPNGDGKNDIFQPEGQYVKSFEMYIYNEQGMQIYHTADINQGWNGTTTRGSKVCQEGTYVYIISVTDSQNKNHTYKGSVTLIK